MYWCESGPYSRLSAKELMLSNCGIAEDSWESLGFKIKLVNSKGNQFWIFFERTDAEAETPILWPPVDRNWLIGKDPEAGKDWRQEEKGTTEDEIVRWQHWLNGHEFEQAPGDGKGQGGLECCSRWGHKSLTWLTTEKQQQRHTWASQVVLVVKNLVANTVDSEEEDSVCLLGRFPAWKWA